MLHITSISFNNYKPFSHFSISLNGFNILVGPNNAGKSTIIGALKILSEGVRKAKSKKPEFVKSLDGGTTLGYKIDLTDVPVATENVFHNYDESNVPMIKFRFSNNSVIQIYFPTLGECFMTCEVSSRFMRSPKDFKELFNVEIGFVPVLGPVEHKEQLFLKEAARLALLTSKASRNFRNIWYHYPDKFPEFKKLIQETWPGMDIDLPEIDRSYERPVLNMFCPEERIPREIYWAGFGFQVWCQMLTYIVQNKNATIFVIDEPDIYLHSDLQRQLLGILKNLGPDIIIATHSTELISEAEINDILLINKSSKSAKRVKDPSQVLDIFKVLGSSLNPVLTQIAKSRRVLFVEGKDFSIFSKFARKLNLEQVANRSNFAVIPVEGFNPQRLRSFKDGIEKTIGGKILSAVIFDRDYRSDDEAQFELTDLKKDCFFAHIHSAKEIENFLLIPQAIEAAIKERIREMNTRTGTNGSFKENIVEMLGRLSDPFKIRVLSQLQSMRRKYIKVIDAKLDEATINERIIMEFEQQWNCLEQRFKLIPGKEFVGILNKYLQDTYKITVTSSNIIYNLSREMYPSEMKHILESIDRFRIAQVESNVVVVNDNSRQRGDSVMSPIK